MGKQNGSFNDPNGRIPSHPSVGCSQLLDDAEAKRLVAAARRSEEQALTRIYQLYADRVFRYVYFRLGERNRAEELVGEVFVRLIENIGDFRLGVQGHALALTGWIYRIAHNLIIDEYRRQQVRGEAEVLEDDQEDASDLAFPEDLHLTRADLQLALKRLTGDQQAVILLRFDEGMSTVEIARILGKSETAVKALQRRGLAAMARYLAPDDRAESESVFQDAAGRG